jgi:hypothetical protein
MSGEEGLTPGRRSRHRQMLFIAAAVVVLSLLLEVRPDQRVQFGLLPGLPMPETCFSRSVFHVPCPGCGLTRSLICLAHGDLRGSLAMHRLGWLMALAVLLQFPYRIAALVRHDDAPLGVVVPRWFSRLLIAGLIGNWVVGIVSG